MKKSIAILSVVVMLSSNLGMKNYEYRFPKSGNAALTSLLPEQIPLISFACFKVDGGENPPWKDPWQWFQIFRELWSF